MPGTRRPTTDIETLISTIREVHAFGLKNAPPDGKWSYRSRGMAERAVALGVSQTTLRRACVFAAEYGEAELNTLIDLLRQHPDCGFGPSHLGVLLTVPEKRRPDFLQRCVEGGWSKARFGREVTASLGRRQPGGGRRPAVGAGKAAALAGLETASKRWALWVAAASEKAGADEAPLERLDKEVRDLVDGVTQAFDRLRAAVRKQQDAAREASAGCASGRRAAASPACD